MNSSFELATEFVASNPELFSDDIKLQLYALYKQVTVGDCTIPAPSFWEFLRLAMYNKWISLKGMDPLEARAQYIQIVNMVVPQLGTLQPQAESHTSFGPVISQMKRPIEEEEGTSGYNNSHRTQAERELILAAKNDDLASFIQLASIIDTTNFDIDAHDHMGLTLLHWAADRGSINVMRYLIETLGANIDALDIDNQTPLQYAKDCEHHLCADYLSTKHSKPRDQI